MKKTTRILVILLLTPFAVFLLSGTFAVSQIAAAPVAPTDPNDGPATNAPTNVADQTKDWLYFNAIAKCMAQSALRDSDNLGRSNRIDSTHAGTFEWFFNPSFTVGDKSSNDTNTYPGVLIDTGGDGNVTCGNSTVIGSGVRALGFSDPIFALCSFGFVRENGSDCVNGTGDYEKSGDVATKFRTAVNRQLYGVNNADAQQLTNVMKYYLYTQSFFIGCKATATGPYEGATPSEINQANSDKGYVLSVVNSDGTITETIYSGKEGHGHNVTISTTPKTYDEGKETCANLVSKANALASTYATYVKNTGDTTPTGGAAGDPTVDPDACGIENGALRWIACPITSGLKSFTDFMSGAVSSLLTAPTEQIFDTTHEDSAKAYYSAWGVFRNLGIGLIVIAGLVMVISQIAGMEIFDAYTIRKVLPRLVIAMIGISLSWPILQFVVTFFNDIGLWAHHLILAPFSKMPEADFNTAGAVVNYLLFAGGSTIAIISIAGLGFAGVLSLLGTIVLALLIGLFVLAIRQLIIVVAIIIAPLAIAAYILPGTQKLWSFWRETLLTALMMFPIIMAFLAAGQAMSFVASQGGELQKLIGLIVYFAPYALLPFAFKLAGGLMSTIFSIANDRSKGLFDRGKNFRAETRKRRGDEFASGRRKAPGLVTGAYRRTRLAADGGFSLTKGGRSRYAAATQSLHARTAAEMLKNDDGRAAGDDDATSLALQKGMNRSTFLSEYAKRKMYKYNNSTGRYETDGSGNLISTGTTESAAAKAAQESLATLETSFGARIGTDSMRVAAFKARAASTTGYGGSHEAWALRKSDANSLMQDGLITTTDAAAAFKVNKARADQSGVGFGDMMQYLEGTQNWTTKEMAEKALSGSQPGALLAGHKNAVSALSPVMLDRLDAAYASNDNAEINRQLAEIAGRYDVMAQISPESARIMAQNVMTMPAGTTGTTVQDAIERARTNPDFVTMRREYGAADRAAAAAAAASTGTPTMGGTPGAPGGIGGVGGL